MHMALLRADVQNRIQVDSGAGREAGPWSWEEPVDGVVPRHALQDAAVDRLVRDKQVLLLAHERGLVAEVDHERLVEALEQENAARAAAIERGETVYGLSRYDLGEFWTATLAELEAQLRRELSSGPAQPLYVAPEEIEARYDADPEAWAASVAAYEVRRLSVPDDGSGTAATLDRRLDGDATLEQVAARIRGATVTTERLDADDPAPLGSPARHALDRLAGLEPGGRTPPFAAEGRLEVYELLGTRVDRDEALTTYASRIREAIVAERFQALLAERAARSAVEIESRALRSIQMKELQQ